VHTDGLTKNDNPAGVIIAGQFTDEKSKTSLGAEYLNSYSKW
jgi:hypothetical protein